MRIALISDIHGNFTALEAVLADIDGKEIDSIICLGDVATVGPQPKQVLDRLKTLGCSVIMGNHDAALLDMDAPLEYGIAAPIIPTILWCAKQLVKEDLDYLDSFRALMEISLGLDTNLLCFHGSPGSNTDLITATTSPEELDNLLGGQERTIMAGGHSHVQMLRQHNGTLIINPGSIGNAFLKPHSPGTIPTLLPWAEYAIVNWAEDRLSVELCRVPFDLSAFSEIASSSDIPIRSWWLEQYSSTHAKG